MHDEFGLRRDQANLASRPSWPGPAPAHAGPTRPLPRRGRDRDASTPRSRRRRAERCRPPRPAACAIADAGRLVRPRRRLGVPSACAAVGASGTFFSQRLGKLRPADANALTRLDLDLQPRDRPVAPVGYRLFEQGRGDTQGRFTLHRGRRAALRSKPGCVMRRRPRRSARPQCANTGHPPNGVMNESNRHKAATRESASCLQFRHEQANIERVEDTAIRRPRTFSAKRHVLREAKAGELPNILSFYRESEDGARPRRDRPDANLMRADEVIA